MKCSECGAMIPDDADECPSCGVPRTASASSAIDQIADDTAQAIHDVVRVVKSVQRVGDEVAEASRSAAKAAKTSSKSGAGKIWNATRTLVADGEQTGKVSAQRLRARGRAVRQKAGVAGHRAKSTARKVEAKGQTARRKVALAAHRTESKVRSAARKARTAARRSSRSR
jgi:zinc-ribbon domain